MLQDFFHVVLFFKSATPRIQFVESTERYLGVVRRVQQVKIMSAFCDLLPSGWVCDQSGRRERKIRYASMKWEKSIIRRIPKNVFSLPCFSSRIFIVGIIRKDIFITYNCYSHCIHEVDLPVSTIRVTSLTQAFLFFQGTFGSISFIVASTMRRPWVGAGGKEVDVFILIPLSKLIGNDIVFCLWQGHRVILNGLDFCHHPDGCVLWWSRLCRLFWYITYRTYNSLPCLVSRLHFESTAVS